MVFIIFLLSQGVAGGEGDLVAVINQLLDKPGERKGDGLGDTREIYQYRTRHLLFSCRR